MTDIDPEELIRKNEEYIEKMALYFESMVFSITKKIMESANYKSLQAAAETVCFKISVYGDGNLPMPYLLRAIVGRINSRGNLVVTKFDGEKKKHQHSIEYALDSRDMTLTPTQNLWKTGRDIPINTHFSSEDSSKIVFSSVNGNGISSLQVGREPMMSTAVEVCYKDTMLSPDRVQRSPVDSVTKEVDMGIIDLMKQYTEKFPPVYVHKKHEPK